MMVQMAVGDAYGMGFEYSPRSHIRRFNDLSRYVSHPTHKINPGCYTDDTQMSIALAEALLEENFQWNAVSLANKFVEAFRRDPRQGYSRGFHAILVKAKTGEDLLRMVDPESDKSGASMRSLPLGVLHTPEEVIEKAVIQARITHDSLPGRASAAAAALLAHYFLYNLGPKKGVGKYLDKQLSKRKDVDLGSWDHEWSERVGAMGGEAVSAAITAMQDSDTMTRLLQNCVEFGGDVDTVATIALGAAAHCKEIEQNLPSHLIHGLEPGGQFGFHYLMTLDIKLLSLVNHV